MLSPNPQEQAPAVNFLPANIGSSEPDGGPLPSNVMTPQQNPAGAGDTGEPDSGPLPGEEGGDNSIRQHLEMHLNQLPDNDKQFLAEHLTPEFVRAIGLINGPEVAQYLNQYVDPNKVLVPVPRQIAEQYLQAAKQQGNSAQTGQPQATQGQPPAAQAAPMAQPQGMMAPQQATATSPQQVKPI